LEAIIAVGYRADSERAIQFRQWATKVLSEFSKKGYLIDKQRLINDQVFSKRYFDELVAEIQEIRASERKFYQKITEEMTLEIYRRMKKMACIALTMLFLLSFSLKAGNYNGFKVSIYIMVQDVNKMQNTKWLDSVWTNISSRLKVDKVFIETYRSGEYATEASLVAAKKFFSGKKIEYAGGITFFPKRDKFVTFCYTQTHERTEVKKISELTAKHFDEFILDDFFFNNCKCEHCTAAKGDKSWTNFRLELMNDAAKNLVVDAAKAVNPKCKVIIKYPNWYEHFPAMGFDLGAEAKLFDGIWTGTETRNDLPPYMGYEIIRYFSNTSPGKNGGGWVDPYEFIDGNFTATMNYADRYAEQLWLTLFGKAPECTLFNFSDIYRPVSPTSKAKWQGAGTSFDWDKMGENPTIGSIAAQAFEGVNKFYSKLGNPVGIKSYKPIHSNGDDYLQNFLGMTGLPIEMAPEFPTDAKMVLLTAQAAHDKQLVGKIKKHLKAGKEVMITSDLLALIQKELEDIVELRMTGKRAFINDFGTFGKSAEIMLLPEILYNTCDITEDITVTDRGVTGWQFLFRASYENSGLWVLTIPDSYADIYQLPQAVLNRIRTVASSDLNVRLEGPDNVSLFVYDNGAFIVESFRDEPLKVKIIVKDSKRINDMLTNTVIDSTPVKAVQTASNENSFEIELKPHSYRVFKQ
jgi:hypothetical protein